MLRREDVFVINATINTSQSEQEVKIKQEFSLGSLQDVIGSIIEAAPSATSFVFCVVRRVTHTEEALPN